MSLYSHPFQLPLLSVGDTQSKNKLAEPAHLKYFAESESEESERKPSPAKPAIFWNYLFDDNSNQKAIMNLESQLQIEIEKNVELEWVS